MLNINYNKVYILMKLCPQILFKTIHFPPLFSCCTVILRYEPLHVKFVPATNQNSVVQKYDWVPVSMYD